MLKKYERKISNIQDAFDKDMSALAHIIFEEKVKPWLVKHDRRLLTGMGTWIIIDNDSDETVDWTGKRWYDGKWGLSKTIVDIMDYVYLVSGGFSMGYKQVWPQVFGALMPDFDPRDTEGGQL